MAGAYSTIANDGVYIEPTFYSKIEKKDSTTVVETKQKSRKVFSKEVAYILKEILTEPVEGTYGTATYCKISGVDVAAKTGTTDENYDRWLCGFTPYYTAVTWFGFDQNESIEFNKRNPAGLIWANVMSRIHTGLKSAKFVKPNTVQSCTICAKTGKRATTGCPNTYTEYFLWLTTPDLCDKHAGSELKENTSSNTNTQNNEQETIKGTTNEIDAIDPQQVPQENVTTNTNRTNTNTNTNSNTNTNYSTNNTNTNTNTSNNVNTNNTTNNTNSSGSSNNTNSQNSNSSSSNSTLSEDMNSSTSQNSSTTDNQT